MFRSLVVALVPLGLATGCQVWDEPAPMEPAVYVALGASDAVGVGAHDMARHSWPAVVHAGLPEGTQLLNLGISGATLSDVLRAEMLPAVDARPRWVSIWPGVNDLSRNVPLTTFSRQLDEILGRLSQPKVAVTSPPPMLIVLNLPDLRQLPALAFIDPMLLDRTVQQWNAEIARIAERHGAMLVDLYSYRAEFAAHPEYVSADGFHPSTEGYRRIAELVLATMDTYVPSPTS
jgi:lysophospholipase L1-like esterase